MQAEVDKLNALTTEIRAGQLYMWGFGSICSDVLAVPLLKPLRVFVSWQCNFGRLAFGSADYLSHGLALLCFFLFLSAAFGSAYSWPDVLWLCNGLSSRFALVLQLFFLFYFISFFILVMQVVAPRAPHDTRPRARCSPVIESTPCSIPGAYLSLSSLLGDTLS